MSLRCTKGQNESAFVWQGICVAQHGRQVHPGQTNTVKGQNSKILVTVGTIKRPYRALYKGRKTEDFFTRQKRKTE